jgi:hypothetical protein
MILLLRREIIRLNATQAGRLLNENAELRAENETLRIANAKFDEIVRSHMQSGCKCRFCVSAREVIDAQWRKS